MVWSNQYISHLQYWPIMPHSRFCFVLNASRPLLELEQRFFDEQRAGNGMWHLTIVEFRHWRLNAEYRSDAVPVIAVFTKFDDLVVQLYDRDREEEENHTEASKVVKEKFEMPLENSRDRPKAYVCFEGVFIYLLFQALPSEHLFQPLMMTKVTIKNKWRVWLRKLLLLLMTLRSRCYLSLSSKTTLNYASNMLYMSKLLLWELTTEMVIYISEIMI